ncbi:hypothetical protein BH20ACI3_BH20ACI3_43260 [soil metagenome]
MTTDELRTLLETSTRRSEAIEAKHASGEKLSRRECDELRHCTQRIGLIARELWLTKGKPDGFPELEGPIPLSPLPKSMRAIDLTDVNSMEVH